MPWWRGYDGEDDMTEEDWLSRAFNAARGMINGQSPEQTNPDDDGTPTYGCYNGDYSEEEHQRANYLLDEDPEYADRQTEAASQVNQWWNWLAGNVDDDGDDED